MSAGAAQMDLFAAKRERDRAIERVLSTPQILYRERLWKAITDFSIEPEPFTTDDIRTELGDPPPGVSPNLVGAVVMTALKRGVIKQVGLTRSARVIGHSNRVGLYVGAGWNDGIWTTP